MAGELLGCAVHREVEAESCSPFGDFGSVWSSKETCLKSGPNGCTGMLQMLKTLFQDLSRRLRRKMGPLYENKQMNNDSKKLPPATTTKKKSKTNKNKTQKAPEWVPS